MSDPLRHPLLAARARHGFGTRSSAEPPGLLRPRQVHGAAVVRAAAWPGSGAPEADAVVSSLAGAPVGVATADCVPILLASDDGAAVAAVHAGWRGLARGVVEAGVDALRQEAAARAPDLAAVIGPHIGACCYEVDAPVVRALRARFGDGLGGALTPSRPGHFQLDLGLLARRALLAAGLAGELVGVVADACTRCDARRFHSYRRDGPRAGRLVHFVAAAAPARMRA